MWVLLVLLLLLGSIVPLAGKLGDIIGQARIYVVGYWCFVSGSLGAGFVSPENKGFDLIAARIVVGFGAALLFTNSTAILINAFAPYGKVGLSQGIFQLSSAMGIVLGPLIGGAFATSDWRWIFWFNTIPGVARNKALNFWHVMLSLNSLILLQVAFALFWPPLYSKTKRIASADLFGNILAVLISSVLFSSLSAWF